MNNHKIHQIKINFCVTESVKRYVYVYIIEAEKLYMIDSGVCGCEKQIGQYLENIGRNVSEIKAVFLTHAHPDHIGAAAWFKENTGCDIYAAAGERRWIEDIDIHYKERPIPNFYNLSGRSVSVDFEIKDGDVIELEDGLCIEAVRTAGHSADEMSYRLQKALFIGDSVPVKGDIPIFIDEQETRQTLCKLGHMHDIDIFYPAWDCTYTKEVMREKLAEAEQIIDMLKDAVITSDDDLELPVLTEKVAECLRMPMLKDNPLFAVTVGCLREGEKR